MDAAETALRPGDRLDRYELLCPIASGGMATVWLARMRGKRGFEKLFAVKTIRTELVEDARFQEMFLDEARIASGIQHPNVAQILDLGEQRDVLFIVMEWVDGDSLAKVRKLAAKEGVRVPVGVALRTLADACAGLHAAHELRDEQGQPLGIVHRDVSPQNILVSAAGTVKVIDFGIAKAHNRRQGETGTGVVKGKIQYMAPEQVKKGRKVDRRTDVWALGVCLHELVAGRLPNEGDDDVEVIRKLLADEAPQRAEGLAEPVGRILDRSVALEPDDRFPSAAGMQRALESAMKELGEATTSEDVAAFLRAALPDLGERRKTLVAQAITEARDRRGDRREASGEEVAFAPTIVSEDSSGARSMEEARAISLTKRKPEPIVPAPETVREPREPRPLWPNLASELPPLPKRSSAGVWLVLGLMAAGLAAAGGRAYLRSSGSALGPVAATSVPASASAPSLLPIDLEIPSAAAVPSSAPETAAAAALRPRERGAGEPIEPRSLAESPEAGASGPLAATGASLDAGVPLAAGDAQSPLTDAMAAEAAAAPAASAASGAAEDDPNNPYN